MLLRLARLLLAHPRLVAAHARAYADLLSFDLQHTAAQCARQGLLILAALGALAVAAVLAGAAWMLWAGGLRGPDPAAGIPLAYVLSPAAALLVALVCAALAWRGGRPHALQRVRAEWARDRRLLHGEEGAPP